MNRSILDKIKKKLTDFYPFIFFLIIILIATRKFLFKDGYVLFGEFPSSINYFFFLKNILNSWNNFSILGHSNIGFPTTYGLNQAFMVTPPAPNIIWFGFMSLLQFLFGNLWSVKIYILLLLFLPFTSMYYFAKFWFKELEQKTFLLNSIAFTSGLIYSINSLMGDRIFAGHLFYNLGYGIFPFLLLFIFKSVETDVTKTRIKFILIAGLITSTLIWIMPHLLIIAIAPIVLYFLFFSLPDVNKIKIFLIVGVTTSLIGLVLDIYLWFPALIYSETYPYLKDGVYILNYLYNIAPQLTLDKILTLSSPTDKLFLSKEKLNNLFIFRLFLPFLSVVGLIFTRDRRKSLFVLLLIILGIIFGMGVNFPFENLYGFLYQHIFLFKPFRDSSKFIVLYIFGLSLAIPSILVYLNLIFKNISYLIIALFAIFILYVNPMFTSGNFEKNIVAFRYPKKYDSLNNFLNKQKDKFRVAIYPNDRYVGNYDWYPKIPNGSVHPTLFSFFLPLSKDLAVSNRTIGNFSSRYLDYLESNLQYPWTVNRLGEEMVKYIIVDQSMNGYQKDTEKLQHNSAVSETNVVDGFNIFEIKNFSSKMVKNKPSLYYYGDMKGIKNIPSYLALINIGLNPTDILEKNYSDYLLLYDSTIDDAFHTTLDKYNFSFFPEIRFTKDLSKGFYSPGEYLRDLTLKGINFYNPEIIAANGKNKIKKISNLKSGNYKVLLRILSFENLFTNKIGLTIGDQVIIKSNFRQKDNTFEWVDFGQIEVKNDRPAITVENLGSKSFYLDNLIIIPTDQYDKLRQDFDSIIKSKRIISFNDSELVTLDFLKQNKKTVNVLSTSFSPYWKICDRAVFRVNFFATGVVCRDNTNLHPQFKPEFIYKISLLLTFLFYLSIGLFIIKFANKYDKTN